METMLGDGLGELDLPNRNDDSYEQILGEGRCMLVRTGGVALTSHYSPSLAAPIY